MWDKKGLLFKVAENISESLKSHASIPFCLHLTENHFRVFFSSRNSQGKSLPYYIDAIIHNDQIILIGKPIGPLFDLGKIGTFDDSGIMPSSIVKYKNKLYMYYIGWNPLVTVSYRLSIGLAISSDSGQTFTRFSKGPICDRSIEEPYFSTAPYVIKEGDIWRMWYISCTKWQIIKNYPEPSYHVKYAESLDGIHWKREGKVCIDYDEKAKAIGRPCILKKRDLYYMYFSYRDITDYRTKPGKGYQIGLAISKDGLHWNKKYDETGINLSTSGWDNIMIEYCHVFEHEGIFYMLYNGNDFGKEGFGYAVHKG